MDGGRRDGRVTGSNRELVKIADDVSGGVEAFHRCLLVYVDLEVTHLRAIGAQRGGELGTDFAPECRIQDIEVEASAALDRYPHAIFNAFRAARVCRRALCRPVSTSVASVSTGFRPVSKSMIVPRIGSQEQRLMAGFMGRPDDADVAVHRFEAIADRQNRTAPS